MRYSATAGSAGELGAAPGSGVLSALNTAFAPLWQRLKVANARRRRSSELIDLDERLLRDVGVAEDEIPRLRARKRLLPVGWPD